MSNNRILVLGLGHLSNGELTIALETVRHLPSNGFELLFISHPNGANYIRSTGIPCMSLDKTTTWENRTLFEKILTDFNPGRILCADVYTMEYASVWCGIDFEYLKRLGLPLGSFDQYEWESTNFEWDFTHAPPVKIRPELIKSCDFLIRPCPLNKVDASQDSRIITCRLFGKNDNKPKMSRSMWAEALSINLDRKVIFTVKSSWEYVDVSNSVSTKAMIEQMPKIIHGNISLVGEPVTLAHVGPRQWTFPIASTIDYRYFPALKSDLYRECLAHADLFMGTNAISITLSNAVFLGTPSILLNNFKVLDFQRISSILPKMPSWYQDVTKHVSSVFAFRMFPWGWSKFLSYVFADNPYQETFLTVPVMEPSKCKKAIEKYLFDESAISEIREKQQVYFSKLSRLRPLEEQLM